jgi:hypothetical protein
MRQQVHEVHALEPGTIMRDGDVLALPEDLGARDAGLV